jgi:methyl-accepting chemotaxis protein
MKKNNKHSSSVTIGNVSGSIDSSLIAGGNISEVSTSVKKSDAQEHVPSMEELNELLANIRGQLIQLASKRDGLASISPSMPHGIQGVHDCVEAAIENVKPTASQEQTASAGRELAEAGSLLTHLMNNATKAVDGVSKVAESAKPLVRQLSPLIQSLSLAATWIAKIWS